MKTVGSCSVINQSNRDIVLKDVAIEFFKCTFSKLRAPQKQNSTHVHLRWKCQRQISHNTSNQNYLHSGYHLLLVHSLSFCSKRTIFHMGSIKNTVMSLYKRATTNSIFLRQRCFFQFFTECLGE